MKYVRITEINKLEVLTMKIRNKIYLVCSIFLLIFSLAGCSSKDIEKLYEKFITPYQGNWLMSTAQEISKDFNLDIHEFIRQKIFNVWLKDNNSILYNYMKGFLSNLLLEQTHVIEQTKLHTRKK